MNIKPTICNSHLTYPWHGCGEKSWTQGGGGVSGRQSKTSNGGGEGLKVLYSRV